MTHGSSLEHAFPENVIACALSYGAKCRDDIGCPSRSTNAHPINCNIFNSLFMIFQCLKYGLDNERECSMGYSYFN